MGNPELDDTQEIPVVNGWNITLDMQEMLAETPDPKLQWVMDVTAEEMAEIHAFGAHDEPDRLRLKDLAVVLHAAKEEHKRRHGMPS